jgi:hypothetical protein
VSGMIDWFRDLSISNPGAKKFGVMTRTWTTTFYPLEKSLLEFIMLIAVTLLLSQNKLLLLVMI